MYLLTWELGAAEPILALSTGRSREVGMAHGTKPPAGTLAVLALYGQVDRNS